MALYGLRVSMTCISAQHVLYPCLPVYLFE